jgi:hypothetical protein
MSALGVVFAVAGLVVAAVLVAAITALRREIALLHASMHEQANATRWVSEAAGARRRDLDDCIEEIDTLRSTGTQSLVGDRVVANLEGDQSIRGVMTADHPSAVVLEHAEYLSGRQPEAFSGRAVLPRAKVLWLQALGAEEG